MSHAHGRIWWKICDLTDSDKTPQRRHIHCFYMYQTWGGANRHPRSHLLLPLLDLSGFVSCSFLQTAQDQDSRLKCSYNRTVVMSTTLASNASGQSMEQDESRDSFSPDDVGTSTDSEVDDPGDVQELHEKSRRTAQNELFKALWEKMTNIVYSIDCRTTLTQCHQQNIRGGPFSIKGLGDPFDSCESPARRINTTPYRESWLCSGHNGSERIPAGTVWEGEEGKHYCGSGHRFGTRRHLRATSIN